ncbi:MAG: energy transducer TonB [Pseudomonadota bacterium]
MSRTALLACAFVLTASTAAAQTVWTAAPTAQDMAAAYPEKARAEGVGGGVELVCTAARNGAMTDCDVLAEEPRGYGFGVAARRLAERHMQAAGVRKDAEVRVSVSFPAGLAKGETVTVKTPQWTALPTAAEMQALVPKQEGGPNEVRVTLVCDVAAGGALTGCVVDREEPAGEGFGEAVLKLAPKFQTGLMSAEGMPTVGARVRLPVRFSLTPVDQAAK